jgi:hypothetical protein
VRIINYMPTCFPNLPACDGGGPGSKLSEHARQELALCGQVSGTWQSHFVVPDVGGWQTLQGSGEVGPLGMVQMKGELHTPGFIRQGEATATVTLSSAAGSVTLQLVGPLQPGFSPPPSTFQYTITGGTGLYAGASGSGRVAFQEQPEKDFVYWKDSRGPRLPAAGTFTMTFLPAAG